MSHIRIPATCIDSGYDLEADVPLDSMAWQITAWEDATGRLQVTLERQGRKFPYVVRVAWHAPREQ